MALQDFRYEKQEPLDEQQLQDEAGSTAVIGNTAGGHIIDINFEETVITDLDESMAKRGYVRTEGPGVTGIPGDAAAFVRRVGDTMTGNLTLDGATADVALTNSARVTGVLDTPTALSDAVNANYVQSQINARDPKEACRVGTAGVDIVVGGWTSSGSGVGKTLTSPTDATANNDFDGVTLSVGDRILVHDSATGSHNGIYEMTTLADGGGQNAIITRATDADETAEVTQGLYTFISQGTVDGAFGFQLTTVGAITVDTTAQAYTAVSAADNVVDGAGVVRAVNTLAVDLDTAADAQTAGSGGGSSGLEFDAAGDAGELRVKVDPAAGIQRNAAGLGLELAAAGALVTAAGGASVNVDGSTITINGSNELEASGGGGGLGAAMLFASNSVGSSTTDRFLHPGGSQNTAQTTTIQVPAPMTGTLQNMQVIHTTTAGNGNSIVYTARVAAVDTSITVSLASTSSSGSDLSNTASVTQGDLIDVIVEKASGVGTSPKDIIVIMEIV